ncbi:putative F-box/LRR-repeat protein At3g18150 [Brassica napus]|uniref:putative F-box/LRR-repeat protein At3g18150 n=2 Tax=Brassica napus TaxID=3708 RepID=UPI002079042D|nr:putative F-box/LRR-repeat protein At3g18150 [Brassica napus]
MGPKYKSCALVIILQTKMTDDRKIEGAEDLISNLPDVILQHILCFVPTTKVAIRTSLLSRRWRHVWCEVPSLPLDVGTLTTAASVNEALTRYTAPKTKSFHLTIKYVMKNIPYMDTWIKFAMSHSVENLSLDFLHHYYRYKLPDFLYNSSSVKQLNINRNQTIVPQCTVSWTSLHKLSLKFCRLSDESMAKILSGCPVLEYLKLYHCGELNVLDLSQSPRLRTLEVIRNMTTVRGPRQIVAPHIHCLRLYDPQLSCSLVDVASLTEARLEISCVSLNSDFNANFLQVVVLKMLENLKNAEKVKLGRNFIQILSLAEIRGVPFPVLKVKALTLDTKISHYVIPGIERLLQNSPDLEKLTVGGRAPFRMPVVFLDKYLKLQGFNVNKCWRSKDGGASWNEEHCVDAKLEHVASLVELLLINCTEKLYKIVLLLDERYLKFKTEDLTATLSHNNNVTIVLISL